MRTKFIQAARQNVEPAFLKQLLVAPPKTLFEDHHRHQLAYWRIGPTYLRIEEHRKLTLIYL